MPAAPPSASVFSAFSPSLWSGRNYVRSRLLIRGPSPELDVQISASGGVLASNGRQRLGLRA
eukprot:4402978-Pleurochrysis_carterae.AAC.1